MSHKKHKHSKKENNNFSRNANSAFDSSEETTNSIEDITPDDLQSLELLSLQLRNIIADIYLSATF